MIGDGTGEAASCDEAASLGKGFPRKEPCGLVARSEYTVCNPWNILGVIGISHKLL